MEATQIFNKISELAQDNSKQEELRNLCKSKLDKVNEI